MKLDDFILNIPVFYDPNADKINKRSLGDRRKDHITLRDINKLKRLRVIHALKRQHRLELVAMMYSQGDEDDSESIKLKRERLEFEKRRLEVTKKKMEIKAQREKASVDSRKFVHDAALRQLKNR